MVGPRILIDDAVENRIYAERVRLSKDAANLARTLDGALESLRLFSIQRISRGLEVGT
jgi:hypothetical protein